jgi:GNAT superfamily N-acetyltransferase
MVTNFGSHFFNEAGFDQFAELDIETAIERLEAGIRNGNIPFVLAEVRSTIAGFAGYYIDRDFTSKPIAFLHMFYIIRAYRRSPLARLLVAMVLDLAECDGACAFFVTVAPTGVAGRLLTNVFKRCGFRPIGGALMRKI